MDQVRDKDTERVTENGEQISRTFDPVQVGEMETEQHHVAGHRVGENPSPAEVGVNVQKTAGDAQDTGGGQPFRI